MRESPGLVIPKPNSSSRGTCGKGPDGGGPGGLVSRPVDRDERRRGDFAVSTNGHHSSSTSLAHEHAQSLRIEPEGDAEKTKVSNGLIAGRC